MLSCRIINFSTERLLVVAEKYIGMLLQEFSKIAKAYCVLINFNYKLDQVEYKQNNAK